MVRALKLITAASLVALHSGICAADDGQGGAAGGGGGDPTAAPPANPPVEVEAKKKGKSVYVIWAAAGHAQFVPGQLVKASAEMAEGLRKAGNARPATPAEVKVLKPEDGDVPEIG